MSGLTNHKIAAVDAIWAAFPAFSLMLDGCSSRFCDTAFPTIRELRTTGGDSLFGQLWEHRQLLDPLRADFLLCRLPLESYHVTFWNGLTLSTIVRAPPPLQDDMTKLLMSLPGSLARNSSFLPHQGFDWPVIDPPDHIQLTYKSLGAANSALVAWLEPANEATASILAELEGQRADLTREYHRRFGIRTCDDLYRPHVTLGYFACPAIVGQAEDSIKEADRQIRQAVGDPHESFAGISLYGMTNMTTFFRQSTSANEETVTH